MDKEWLEYWQGIEDLGKKDNDDQIENNPLEKNKKEELEEAKDLYKSVLTDEN